MIKFLKTLYWKMRLKLSCRKYKKYLFSLRKLKLFRYSTYATYYEEHIGYLTNKHSHWKSQVELCNSKLCQLAS